MTQTFVPPPLNHACGGWRAEAVAIRIDATQWPEDRGRAFADGGQVHAIGGQAACPHANIASRHRLPPRSPKEIRFSADQPPKLNPHSTM
ncbi:hypothetical protein AZL_023970 [Azospirillum sp. B510]|nr:hypothetical protein AZL_023970 [Azospirillum sp. B510]